VRATSCRFDSDLRHLGPLLLELFVLADTQASPVPGRGFGTLSAHGARIARRRRTGHLHPRTVQHAIMLSKKRPTVRPRTCDNVYALLRPLGHPWAGHVPQVDSELQQAGGFFSLLSQPLHDRMLRLIGRADDHLPRDCALHIHRQVLWALSRGDRSREGTLWTRRHARDARGNGWP
jgi:hypothetical protein